MPIVYKYLPVERTTYFQNELLRFTQPGDLNDPYECRPFITVDDDFFLAKTSESLQARALFKWGASSKAKRMTERFLRQVKAEHRLRISKNPYKIADECIEKVLQKLNAEAGILSLSRRWNSSLMWAHYTVSHRGFCIGFDADHPFFHQNSHRPTDVGIIGPVSYTEEGSKVGIDDDNIDSSLSILYNKSPDWKYEEEERLVLMLKYADFHGPRPEGCNFDLFSFKVPHSAVRELILGANADASLTDTLTKNAKALDVPLFKARLSRTSYDLERVRIDLEK